MIRKIDLSKRAGEYLSSLPSKQCKQNFMTILRLTKNPLPHDAKKLYGQDFLYRVDVGEYRIIYRFDNEIIYILLIGKRNDGDVYDQLQRTL